MSHEDIKSGFRTKVDMVDGGSKNVRVLLLKANEHIESNALSDDPFQDYYGTTDGSSMLLVPPYPLLELSTIGEYSTALSPTVAAMIANIDITGHKLICRFSEGSVPDDISYFVRREQAVCDNFFSSCVVDGDCDCPNFITLRLKTRWDLEVTGNAYWEVIREPAKDSSIARIFGLKQLPSYTLRLSQQGEQVICKRKVICKVATNDGSGGIEKVIADPMNPDPNNMIDIPFRYKYVDKYSNRRFRKYCQIRNGKTVWFKQFGDPRIMSKKDGSYLTKRGNIPILDRATEIIHFRIYSSRTPYGLPRFSGNLMGVTGERAAEEVCYRGLNSNQIPAMALLVSGGAVTDDSIHRIQEFIEAQVAGKLNYSTVLIIESESDTSEDLRDTSKVKIDLKPLSQYQHTDGLFREYRDGQRANLRESFRIPHLYWGNVEEVGKAAAEARRLTDEQVFSPERKLFDERIDDTILPYVGEDDIDGILHWRYVSNSPDITDTDALVKVLAAGERTGALNPRISRLILEDITNKNLGPVVGIPKDQPFSLTLGKTIRTKGDPTNEFNQPGEQADRRDGLLSHNDMTSEIELKADTGGDDLSVLESVRNTLNEEASKRGW